MLDRVRDQSGNARVLHRAGTMTPIQPLLNAFAVQFVKPRHFVPRQRASLRVCAAFNFLALTTPSLEDDRRQTVGKTECCGINGSVHTPMRKIRSLPLYEAA